MGIAGLITQAGREVKHQFKRFLRFLGIQGRTRVSESGIVMEVPRKWVRSEKGQPATKGSRQPQIVYVRKKYSLPGLKVFNRILTAACLLVNFAFSQFLLGSLGQSAQPLFLLFLTNSYVCLLLLWKYRRSDS